jgi:hypothetical protein
MISHWEGEDNWRNIAEKQNPGLNGRKATTAMIDESAAGKHQLQGG